MPFAALRLLALVTATAVTLAAAAAEIPIYPGAKLDAATINFARSSDPGKKDTSYYLTPDSFEKVYAFYRLQKDATEEKTAAAGNAGGGMSMKLGRFEFKGGSLTLIWPAQTSVGLDPSHTQIAVDTTPSK